VQIEIRSPITRVVDVHIETGEIVEPTYQRGRLAGARLTSAAERFGALHGVLLLRVSLGIVYLWFGLPKFVSGLSPADALAEKTISDLTAHLLTGHTATVLLAVLETSIGVGLVTGWFLRLILVALLGQLAGTLAPLVLFPQEMWKAFPVLTLEGQFIVKNLVFIAAAVTIAGSLQRRRRVAPAIATALPPRSHTNATV
jgi:putative oxidoreductase